MLLHGFHMPGMSGCSTWLAGFTAAPMRTLSVNRLMSLLPLSPSRSSAGSFKDTGDYALPSPRRPNRPKSNLGREVMEKQGSIARTFRC